MSTRRSTRRNAAHAEPTQPALERRLQTASPPPEPSKRKGRKGKAVAAQIESDTETRSQSVTKVTATSRAASSTTTTAATSTFAKRTTRAAKAAGTGSPLRALGEAELKRQPEKKRKRTQQQTTSATPDPEPTLSESTQDENNDEQGLFFSQKFDHDLMHVEESSPAQPVFVNSSESAIALLHKIENAAKESAYVEPSMNEDVESLLDSNVTMEASPQQSTLKTRTNRSSTPARPVASPSGFFSRSFSAIKSKLGFSTSTPQAPSFTSSTTPSKPLPPPDTFTEVLSVPPTPVGERVQTPKKKKRTNHMLKALLKGIEPNDKAKAEEWAKQIIPQLKNDRAFREKRKRLETSILFKDLNHFPSSKPWETGFGDPLADLDDEDVVPGWAVYLDLMAEEEEHKAKKHKSIHEVTMDDDDVLSINEQYAASSSTLSSSQLHDSHGHTASLQDVHPRRSTDPSPMFETPVSHQRGGNVFSELQGHDTAAQIRANDRESLQHTTKGTVHTHNPNMGSFSVPDDSDEEDSTIISETSAADAAPLWTQAPPPAPVPAHAPLPGASPVDAPSLPTVQQPVDEVERQRQRLMKHTPAKPSRLREATYPSPSLLSDAGNESILAATPVHMAASLTSLFNDIPGAEPLDIDTDDLATANAFIASDAGKQQLAANPWPAAIVTYESDEEGLSPE